MTSEDDFQRALDRRPDDWQARLVFADWLEERGDDRAEGYRALGIQQLAPAHASHERGVILWWWTSIQTTDGRIPADWFELIEGINPHNEKFKPRAMAGAVSTRRQVEDAAARAFAKLPPERRAELLAGPPAEPPKPRRKARKA
jgi:uncharacterized protein (TIGR02996 family)